MTQLKDYLFYKDDWATIYCGDCLEIMPLMEPESVDLVVTDPPYNLGKNYDGINDARDPKEYLDWLLAVSRDLFRLLKEGYLYLSHSDKGVYLAKPILETTGLEYIQTLIWWGKNGYSMQLHRKSWSYRHEPILFFQKGDPPVLLECGSRDVWYTSVIEVSRPQSNFKAGRFHPTEKPIKLYKILIQRTPGDIIFDPFLGSGTSIIASKNLNRKSIGIEINPKYCEIAVKRLKQEVFDFRGHKRVAENTPTSERLIDEV